MSGNVTKQITGTFFDLNSVNAGDIIEFNGNSSLTGSGVSIRKAGIVTHAYDKLLHVTTSMRVVDSILDSHTDLELITVEEAEEREVRVIFRSYFNEVTLDEERAEKDRLEGRRLTL